MSNSLPISKESPPHPVVLFVVSHVEKVTGLGFSHKEFLGIESKLKRRTATLGLVDLNAYAAHLRSHLVSETPHLIGLLTTHHTAFFREFVHFEELERRLIPQMMPFLSSRSGLPRLNVWSAATSRGQEAYSLAMFLDHMNKLKTSFEFSILATDIDASSVAIGQNGVYLAREVHQSPALYLANHWSHGKGELHGWLRARDSLKRRIQFKTTNLLQPLPATSLTSSEASKMDVIFCRNVFLYFRKEQIEQTMRHLLSRLEPWGVICLGVCENLNEMDLPVVPLGHSMFVPKDSVHLASKRASLRNSRDVRSPTVGSSMGRSQDTVIALRPAETASISATPEAAPPSAPRSIRVLAVDDSPTVLAVLRKILTTEHGFEVVATAKNLSEARAALARLGTEVDLMTLDLHLGQETGIDYLKSIPSGTRHVPIVVVSSLNRESADLAKAALALGAVDYVEKPEGTHLEIVGAELRAKLSLSARPRAVTASSGVKAPVDVSREPISLRSMSTGSTGSRPSKNIGVLIVDDSPTMARVLSEMIDGKGAPMSQGLSAEGTPIFKVLAVIQRPQELEEALRKHKPDVITLDMNMPGMNGVEVLRRMSPDLHVPAVVVSSLGLEQGSLVLDALACGAVDYFPKPALHEMTRETPVLLEKLWLASQVQQTVRRPRSALARPKLRANGTAVAPGGRAESRGHAAPDGNQSQALIAIGASTGGTEAIREVLAELPLDLPPICIVQHIPPVFSAAFAMRLRDTCQRPVVEVRDGETLLPGHAYVAPGDRHFTIKRTSTSYVASLLETPKHGGHRPSVDVLFESIADLRVAQVYALLLTGMGKDGAAGLRKLRDRGARTICQSEKSCVVYGMPRVAVEMGAAEFSEDLDDIAPRLVTLLKRAS